MSDSPYSLRALGEKLHAQGFTVLGLRMPGHGAAPSGLASVTWQDMSAAVRLGMEHLAHSVEGRPIHIIGYSTGAPLALDFALQAEQDSALQSPASLILISPAIGISPAAALAKWKVRLSALPGLSQIAWLQIQPEFDPYKFNSFATNAAEQVHRLTRSVADRIAARAGTEQLLPPILVFKSTVDATVTNDAVVDLLFAKLAPGRDELVLFDFNRFAASSSLLNDSTGAFTARLLEDRQLPFSLTVVANTTALSRSVSATSKAPFGNTPPVSADLMQKWPAGVFSLSHVALPFPPSDPLYGNVPPRDRQQLFLGAQALQGERGVLKIPADFLLRLRYNPFYDYLEQRVLDWTKPWPE
jgi:esterase/lipase